MFGSNTFPPNKMLVQFLHFVFFTRTDNLGKNLTFVLASILNFFLLFYLFAVLSERIFEMFTAVKLKYALLVVPNMKKKLNVVQVNNNVNGST